MAVYNIFFVPSRADRLAMEARVHKLEVNEANHGVRLQGIQQFVEKAVDSLNQRCTTMEHQMSEMGKVREDMAGVKAELKHIAEGYRDINNKLDRLLERDRK